MNCETVFKEVINKSQIKSVARLGYEIWNEHYAEILGTKQIDYMLEKFQSERAVSQQLYDGYRYFLIENCGEDCGYIGISSDSDRLFLSKLYLKKVSAAEDCVEALKMLEEICRKESLCAIWLTVNRHNSGSIAVYKKKGFNVIDEQVSDIGCGYVMDDYIMQLDVR